MFRPLRFLPLLLLAVVSPLTAEDSPLAGSWKIDPAHSTELSPWQDYDLTISVAGDEVTLHQRLAWGRREFNATMNLDTRRPETVVPVEMWPNNRHLGAYTADHTKRVRTEWLDHHRILRLSTDLVLATQQGSREVNILSDYKVSANGAQLTLTELRSTRNRPVVYVFSRVKSDQP